MARRRRHGKDEQGIGEGEQAWATRACSHKRSEEHDGNHNGMHLSRILIEVQVHVLRMPRSKTRSPLLPLPHVSSIYAAASS